MRFRIPAIAMIAAFPAVAFSCGDTVSLSTGGPLDAATADDTEHDAGTGDAGTDAEIDAGTPDAGTDAETADSSDPSDRSDPFDAGYDGGGFTCTPSPAYLRSHLVLDVTVDVTRHHTGVFPVKETVKVLADADGCGLTLFGEGFTIKSASVPYEYDGHTATFAAGPYSANNTVSVTVEFEVPAAYIQNDWGLHDWPGQNGEVVVGPFNEPYFVPMWLFVPQALHSVDPVRDDSPSFDSIDLDVIVPDSSWTVAGPGGGPGTRMGNAWRFSFTGPTPLYALSFAASPDYGTFAAGTSQGGVAVRGVTTASTRSAGQAIFPAAVATVEWMEQNIGAYDFGGSLDLVEVPGMPGGMEHTGAIWLGSDVITDSYEGYFVVVHETVHQWWGDSVMFSDWPHFWLAEGFDEWTTNYRIMGEFLDAQSFDELKYQYRYYAAEMCVQAQSALRFDDNDDMVDHFNGDLQHFYIYGAAALQMVEARLVRDFSTDLVTVLRQWYSARRLTRVTTEEFEAFLGDLTGDAPYWNAFFDQWVYAVPCPTLVASSYSYTGGTAQFTLTRSGGAGQDLMGLPIWFVTNAGRHEVRVDLPWSAQSVTVTAQPPATPTRIVVDPDSTFVFPLKRKTGAWNGPSLGLSFTPYQIPPPANAVRDARRWVKY